MQRGLMRYGSRIITTAAILAVLAAFMAGCADDGPAGPGMPVSWAHIAPYTHLVDAVDSPLHLVYTVDSTYLFTITDPPPHIEAGHIIIGSAGEGYIRRVTEVAVSGNEMILQTTKARLTDAVIRGGTEIRIPIGFGSMLSTGAAWTGALIGTDQAPDVPLPGYLRCSEGTVPSGGGIDISNLTLFEQEISGYPASIRIDEGRVEFNPELHLGLGVGDGKIEKLESRIDGTFTFDCDLSVDIPEPMAFAGELPLASAGRRIVHYMGSVPVVAIVELDFILEYEFSGSYSGYCRAGFQSAFDLSLGALYERGRWFDIGTLEAEAAGTPLSCGEFSDANMQISIEPRVTVTLYGEPFAGMECSIRDAFTVSTDTPPVWEWSMSSELNGVYGIDPDVLAYEPARHEIEPLSHTASLGSGPYATDAYIFVLMWGSEGTGDYQFGYPRGTAVDASGDIYVVDSWNNRVQKFAPDSTFVIKWGAEGSGDGQFMFPVAVAADGAGNIYVTDGGNHRVQKFGPDAAFITAWGGIGTGPGEFQAPAGIAVDQAGDVYVADSGNHRVQKFTSAGLFVTEWGGYGTAAGEFDTPTGIAADGTGNIYVTECRNHRVQKFTSSGDALALWGSHGTEDGEFDCPIAVAVDGAGYIYIVDYGNNRLQIFSSDGLAAGELGGPGSGEGQFDRPEGVAVDPYGNIFIVDSRNERIQKFAPKNP